MSLVYHHLQQIDSTNAYLQRQQLEHDIRNWVVSADEQTAGKGMGSNGWESEAGKNLTFSMALDVVFMPAERQFLLSEAVALGIIEVLDKVLASSFEGMSFPAEVVRMEMLCIRRSQSVPSKHLEKLRIKWPNDIYFENRKLAGILINSTIKSNMMDVSIIGIGLNVNQMQFHGWPTHPISLKMITGDEYDLQPLLVKISENIYNKVESLKTNPSDIEEEYLKRLFRYRTWADYEVKGEKLRLFMTGIDPFGRLLLLDETNKSYCFDIKEIKFLL